MARANVVNGIEECVSFISYGVFMRYGDAIILHVRTRLVDCTQGTQPQIQTQMRTVSERAGKGWGRGGSRDG